MLLICLEAVSSLLSNFDYERGKLSLPELWWTGSTQREKSVLGIYSLALSQKKEKTNG